ncbi:MAG: sigma-54-dependent Fis family transcriptional regulator [Gammaproteobacteria bacterium]|nr:sigma-54-dependent Fis family transcriptional regulator [Gammaproteobacteria bacterium]
MAPDSKPLALVVDDEPAICELLQLTLERMDVDVITAANLAAARTAMQSRPIDLCLTDMQLPDGSGLELIAYIQQHMAQVPVAVITAHGSMETAVEALKYGAFDFVSKPLDIVYLRKMVSTALKLRHNREAGSARSVTRLFGQSQAIEQVRVMVAKLARSQAPVHISGESGTGKELVARLIHENGPRADHAFVGVNCGAIPTELMESEFFGHKKGSFTGAVADKEGLFQAAQGGTLFLDEVADLPLHMQVKLLRVIQEKAVRPVGAAKEIAVDVRVLSATHRSLAELVHTGKFREDLYYRINVIELHVPALRERKDDIGLLAVHILERLARIHGRPPVQLAPDALAFLQSYSFPGNVRELENILERALTLAEDNVIRVPDIHLRRNPEPLAAAQSAAPPAAGPEDVPEHTAEHTAPLGEQLGEIEKQAIRKALEQTRYNKTAAAKLLGMTFRQLRYRIKKLKLD